MKKPVHWMSCLLWAAAVLYPITVMFQLNAASGANMTNVFVAMRGAVIVFIQLAALGILVEISDQIRWRGLTPEEQNRLTEPSALDRRLSQ
jgi:hypothetical protein